ncbi:hypothetical protein [Bdellovibrio sp. NC01]|uniref:hypothetical protein n=1 Tax=Bdellovibrio sp. NC01 TaxID=2220073 RepID=UPI00115BCD27|nr:hypothetical protein [Bdellovibrio sp. NC01]QDK39276.1 hypothetical protein DOE51_17605 [Bdellovibrio sp. NC01]
MKTILALFLMIYSASAKALPVVNENVANGGIVTIYPDHKDPHRFYVAPNVVTVAKMNDGKAIFMYTENRKNLFQKIAHIQMVLGAAYTTEDLKTAEAEILKRDPQAQFSGLPFIESSLEMSGELPDLIADNECVHDAGLIGQEQSCGLTLTPRGRSLFLKSIDRKALFLTLNFKYSILGVAKRADNSFADQTITHAVAVRIDGGELVNSHAVIWR